MDIRKSHERNAGKIRATAINWLLRSGIKRNVMLAFKNRFWLASMYETIPVRQKLVAGCFTTGAEAIARIKESPVGIFICTLDLEDGDGIGDSILHEARLIQPTLRCVLLVDHDHYTAAEAARWTAPIIVAARDIGGPDVALRQAQLSAFANTSYRSSSIPPYNPRRGEDTTIKLTKREMDMLKCYALGLSNAEAAERLGLSPHSTKTYSRNLLSKLETNNRQLALLKALGQGLIRPTWLPARRDQSA